MFLRPLNDSRDQLGSETSQCIRVALSRGIIATCYALLDAVYVSHKTNQNI